MTESVYVATANIGASNWLVRRIEGKDVVDDYQVGHGGSYCSCPGAKTRKKSGEDCKHISIVKSHADTPLSGMKRTKAGKLAIKLMLELGPFVKRIFLHEIQMRADNTVKKIVLGVEPKNDGPSTRLARIVFKGLPADLVIY